MTDFTIYKPISTQKLSVGASAGASLPAPTGTVAVHVFSGGLTHIDSTGGTSTTDAQPFTTGAGHYIAVTQGQALSLIRGASESADVDVWLTWMRRPG